MYLFSVQRGYDFSRIVMFLTGVFVFSDFLSDTDDLENDSPQNTFVHAGKGTSGSDDGGTGLYGNGKCRFAIIRHIVLSDLPSRIKIW